MSSEETNVQPNNGSCYMTQAVCKETVKRIDGEIETVKGKAETNRKNIDGLKNIMLTSAVSAVLSLFGVIIILVKGLV